MARPRALTPQVSRRELRQTANQEAGEEIGDGGGALEHPRRVSNKQRHSEPIGPSLGLVRVVWMERLVTVEFGPSRSKRFGRALAEARGGPGVCREVAPGRYQASFVLDEDSASYTGLARLLERVRHWRATEVYEDDELVSAFQAKEMAWCASFQLKSFRACRFHFGYGVLPRCSVCPLFDAERAIRDILGENPPPGNVVEITLGPNLRALLAGELPPDRDEDFEVPDFPPEEWGEPAGGEPPG